MSIIERQGRYFVTLGTGRDRFRASADNLPRAELLEFQELTKRGLYPTRKPVVTRDPKGLVAHKEAADKMTLGKLLDIAVKTKWADSKSKKNLIGVANGMFEVIDHRMHPKDVTAKVMREAAIKLSDRGNTGATINRKLSTLSVLLNIAVEDELIVSRPKLPRRKESEHRIRFLTKAEEDRCLKWCEDRGATELADFIACAVDSGFRRAELLGVRHDQFYDGMLHLEHGETKNNKARAIPCTSRVLAILERRRASGGTTVFHGFTDSQLRRHWEMMVDNLGFSDDRQFVVHMLRHTCASRLAITGHNSAFIKMWMGHATILTTERYMHLSQDTLKAGASSLSGFWE
tara:strand:+ start:879 stop:1916 length:1038 start_codon:yes stop_codon:yes gene_type:complete